MDEILSTITIEVLGLQPLWKGQPKAWKCSILRTRIQKSQNAENLNTFFPKPFTENFRDSLSHMLSCTDSADLGHSRLVQISKGMNNVREQLPRQTLHFPLSCFFIHRTSDSYLPSTCKTESTSDRQGLTLPRSFGANLGSLRLPTSLSSGVNNDRIVPKAILISRAWSLKDACRPTFGFLNRQTSEKSVYANFVPIAKSKKQKGASTHCVEAISDYLEEYAGFCEGY